MLPRKDFVIQGCILLFPFGVGALTLLALILFWGFWEKPADVLNRIGILFEMIGILAVLPDLIGEEKLQQIINDVVRLQDTKKSLTHFLYSTNKKPLNQYPRALVLLLAIGNIISCLVFICTWLGLFAGLPTYFDFGWGLNILILLTFSFLGFVSVVWLLLFVLFVFTDIPTKVPQLYNYFKFTDLFISALGVLITSAFVHMLIAVISLLLPLAKKPIKQTVAQITLPCVLIGGGFQFFATFL